MTTIRSGAWIACVAVFFSGCNGVTVDPVTDQADAEHGAVGDCYPSNPDGGLGYEASMPVPPEIPAHCERCPCNGCSDSLMQMYERMVSYGCGAEFRAFFACSVENALQCKAWGYSPGTACGTEFEAWDACIPKCVEGVDDAGTTQAQGPCVISCSGKQPWGAACKLEGALFACTCTSGPKQGTAFVLNNCLGGWTTIAEGHCR